MLKEIKLVLMKENKPLIKLLWENKALKISNLTKVSRMKNTLAKLLRITIIYKKSEQNYSLLLTKDLRRVMMMITKSLHSWLILSHKVLIHLIILVHLDHPEQEKKGKISPKTQMQCLHWNFSIHTSVMIRQNSSKFPSKNNNHFR